MNILRLAFMFFCGHMIAAFATYFNHRFVFHGPLSKLPFLKMTAKIHSLHHVYAYKDYDPYILVPFWGKVIITSLIMLLAVFDVWLMLGALSFSFLYMYRHWAIHNTDFYSKFHFHHEHHHRRNPYSNLSGVYPFVDRLFGTYEDSEYIKEMRK